MTIIITDKSKDDLIQALMDNVADWANDFIPKNPTVEDAHDLNLAFINVLAHCLGRSVAKDVALSGHVSEPEASLELLSRLPSVFDVIRTIAIESLDDCVEKIEEILEGNDESKNN